VFFLDSGLKDRNLTGLSQLYRLFILNEKSYGLISLIFIIKLLISSREVSLSCELNFILLDIRDCVIIQITTMNQSFKSAVPRTVLRSPHKVIRVPS